MIKLGLRTVFLLLLTLDNLVKAVALPSISPIAVRPQNRLLRALAQQNTLNFEASSYIVEAVWRWLLCALTLGLLIPFAAGILFKAELKVLLYLKLRQ